jgi:YVTN family beta-propeller protein
VISVAALVAALSPLFPNASPRSPRFALTALERPVGTPAMVPFGARLLGPAVGSASLRIDVALRPRDPAALSRFALAVSTPGNPLYHHFLARGRFASVFGPTAATVRAVLSELHRDGLRTGPISSNNLLIPVFTTVAGAEHAFQVSLARYRLPSGRIATANSNAPTLPAPVAGAVQGVIGLDDLNLPQPGATPSGTAHAGAHSSAPAPTRSARSLRSSVSGPAPCAAAVSAGGKFEGWTEDQLAKAYSLPTLYSRGDLGSGVTIGLFELTRYSAADIASFQSCYHTTTPITNIAVNGGPTSSAGAGEAELDIEVVLGLAPKARLLVYETGNSGTGSMDEYTAIVTADKAQVVSSSWGQCEAFLGSSQAAAQNTIFEQAAAQGQSIFSVPGDEGSEGCLPNDFGTLSLSIGKGSAPDGVAIDPTDHTAYVANFSAGTVSVVNELTLSVVTTVDFGPDTGPLGVAVDPTTHKVFVTAAVADALGVISGATCNAVNDSKCAWTAVSMGEDSFPEGVAVDPATKTVYVADAVYGEIAVLSESTLKVVAGAAPGSTEPEGVAVDVATNFVYYAASGDDALGAFAGSTCDASDVTGCSAVAAGVDVGSDPTNVAVDAALDRVYVSNTSSDTVSVVNGTSGAILATVNLKSVVDGPQGLAISPSGTSLLVACDVANGTSRPTGVAVVSLSTDTVTSLLSAGSDPVAVASDPAIGFAAVADSNDGALVEIPLLLDPWDPGTQPFVTGVGGTDLTAIGPAPRESVWDEQLNAQVEFPEGAGGGGISWFWKLPSYQAAPGVRNADSSGAPCGNTSGLCREVPDVSASADPAHGYIVFEQGSWTAVGGTSAAAPLWAAIVGLLDVQQGTLYKLGFVNPALYKLVSEGKPIVNDVTVGNNDYTTTNNGLYPATKGYDMATGLGTPIGTGLSFYLGYEPRPVVSLLTPGKGPEAGGTLVKITGTGMLWVTAVKFGTKAAKFTIVSPTEVIAVSPAGTGTVAVTVTTPGGTSTVSTGSMFTY